MLSGRLFREIFLEIQEGFGEVSQLFSMEKNGKRGGKEGGKGGEDVGRGRKN